MARAKSDHTEARSASENGESISRDTIYTLLSNQRRRYTIHFLQRQGEPVSLSLLAEQVAAWEFGEEPQDISSAQRKTVYTALQQRHLPKMDTAGLVSFDKREGTVAPTDALTELDIYTEVVSSGDFPWSQYYLGLSAVLAVLLVAAATNVYPLTVLPDIAWGVFCVTAFSVSSLVHVYVTRQMKLGTTTRPPEIDHE